MVKRTGFQDVVEIKNRLQGREQGSQQRVLPKGLFGWAGLAEDLKNST